MIADFGGNGVEIFYQGTEITNMVQTRKCIVRDGCGERADSIDLEFENAAGWYAWGPEEDDQIIVTHKGYDSGIMYVNTVLPQDGKYRILATALPCRAREKGNKDFCKKTLEEIMRACAFASGMDFQIFGMDKNIAIPYIERDGEGCAAFLHRFLALEGAVLKCVNGKYTAIGIEYAQGLEPWQTIRISSAQEGAQYRRAGSVYKSVTVKTPYAEAKANDLAVSEDHMQMTMNDLPAMDNLQAGRWARGKLLCLNRKSELVTLESDFNQGFTAMARVDIDGDTDASGEWLVEEAEHDLINLKTSVVMRRCITTIQ